MSKRNLPGFLRVANEEILKASGQKTSEAMVEYQNAPLDFFQDILNIRSNTIEWSDATARYRTHKWDGDPDPFIIANDALVAHDDVGIESGTATGKTFWLAAICLWFLGCFEDSTVVTLAPKGDLLRKNLWKEVERMWPYFQAHFPDAWLGDLMIRMRPESKNLWTMSGMSVGVASGEEVAQKAKGFHEKDMLFVFEETPGIPPAVLTAIEETCRAPHNLRIAVGNPDHMNDPLHSFCADPGVRHIRISCHDHPNVVMDSPETIPGAVSRQSIDKTALKYGRTSRIYLTQVRGISPAEDEDSLIRMDWLRQAARYTDSELAVFKKQSRDALGADVAQSPAGDRAVIARGEGAVLKEVWDRYMADNYDASHFGVTLSEYIERYAIVPKAVGVDSVGVGVSSLNKLKELGYRAQPLNGGSKAPPLPGEERYYDLRAAMYWKLREDLRLGRVALDLPSEQTRRELFGELTLVHWILHDKAIRVERKKEIKKRLGGASPDLADAVVYWNWARDYSGLISGKTSSADF